MGGGRIEAVMYREAMICVALLTAMPICVAAELPAQYQGFWINRASQGQDSVRIDRETYNTDTLRCKIDAVIKGPSENLEAYTLHLTCWLVDERRQRKLQVVVGLRNIDGKPALIVASHYTKWPSIDIMIPQSAPR
jgi:hypothetical protein